MNLEKLVLGAAIALSSLACKSYEIVRKPVYVKTPIKTISEKVEVPKLPPGYEQRRFDNGELGIYKTTLFTPENDLKKEEQENAINERLNYLKENLIPESALKEIRVSGFDINYEKLSSQKLLQINIPSEKENAIAVIQECLNLKSSPDIDFCRSICDIRGASDIKFGNILGYGILLGDRYVLAPATIVYATPISNDLKQVSKVEISMLKDLKIKGEGYTKFGNVLVIDPLKNLALIEIIKPSEKYYWRINIQKNKPIEEVKLYSENTSGSLEKSFNLKEAELFWEISPKESNLAKALRYSIATIETEPRMNGSPFFSQNGLVGIILGEAGFNSSQKRNSIVIGSTLIREFLQDYVSLLKSRNDTLEILIKEVETPIKEASMPAESKAQPETKNQGLQTRNISDETKNLNPLISLCSLAGLMLLSAIIGRRIYLRAPEEVKEPPKGNLDNRLKDVKEWIEKENARLKFYSDLTKQEAEQQAKTMIGKGPTTKDLIEDIVTLGESRIIVPGTIVESAKDQNLTIDGFEEPDAPTPPLKWIKKIGDDMIKVPSLFSDYIRPIVEGLEDSEESKERLERISSMLKERERRIDLLNKEREKRFIALIEDLNRIKGENIKEKKKELKTKI